MIGSGRKTGMRMRRELRFLSLEGRIAADMICLDIDEERASFFFFAVKPCFYAPIFHDSFSS